MNYKLNNELNNEFKKELILKSNLIIIIVFIIN